MNEIKRKDIIGVLVIRVFLRHPIDVSRAQFFERECKKIILIFQKEIEISDF